MNDDNLQPNSDQQKKLDELLASAKEANSNIDSLTAQFNSSIQELDKDLDESEKQIDSLENDLNSFEEEREEEINEAVTEYGGYLLEDEGQDSD